MKLWKSLLIVSVISVSCSVLEDRTECPIYVSVKAQTESDCLVSFFSAGGDLLDSRMIAAEDMRSGNNRTQIPRRDFHVSVLMNKWNMELRGDKVVCMAEGREAAPIYACSLHHISPDNYPNDEIVIDGPLMKQHALVKLRFTVDEGTGFPYFIRLYGERNGFNLLTLAAEEGRCVIMPRMGESLETEFVLTRQQQEDPIMLFLLDEKTGVESAAIEIGQYITKAGYDWNADSLGDIDIAVDLSEMTIAIRISDWKEELIEIF